MKTSKSDKVLKSVKAGTACFYALLLGVYIHSIFNVNRLLAWHGVYCSLQTWKTSQSWFTWKPAVYCAVQSQMLRSASFFFPPLWSRNNPDRAALVLSHHLGQPAVTLCSRLLLYFILSDSQPPYSFPSPSVSSSYLYCSQPAYLARLSIRGTSEYASSPKTLF